MRLHTTPEEAPPPWTFAQVWPDRPDEFVHYRAMVWTNGAWRGTVVTHAGDPSARIVDGTWVLTARGPWPKRGQEGQKLPALLFRAPRPGPYRVSGRVTVRYREGTTPCSVLLRHFESAGGTLHVLARLRVRPDTSEAQRFGPVEVRLRSGDCLALGPQDLAAHNAVTVTLQDFLIECLDADAAAPGLDSSHAGTRAESSSPNSRELSPVPPLDVLGVEEPMRFPASAGIPSVRDYGARGDGVTDDTEAFRKALHAWPKNPIVYVPNGTYLISDTLTWSEGRGKGSEHKRQVLQGESRDGTVIRLRDRCPGFTDPDRPKAMIWTGKAPAQRFRNGLRNLTLHTGEGNSGAIGVQFIANNQGGIRQVAIRSGDGSGVIGLDLGYTDEQGPCLMAHVLVEGFDIGIRTRHAVDSITFDDIALRGQRVVAFLNDGQCVSVRFLRSVNAVPAFRNAAGSSLTVLLDATLQGIGAADALPAVINEAGLFARNLRTEGYGIAIRGAGGTQGDARGPVVDEYVSHEVLALFPSSRRSLNLPMPAFPTVGWDPPESWACLTNFGAPRPVTLVRRSDGRRFERLDWSPVLQRAIDAGASTIYFPLIREADYGLYGPVILRHRVRRIIGCENTLGRVTDSNAAATDYQPEARPCFVLEEGEAPIVVVERFDSWYASPRFEQRSRRTLLLSSLSFYDLETWPGTGDVFLDDVRGKRVTVNGSAVWGRQVNLEGWEEPRILNRGGTVAILGLKTENDPTVLAALEGSRSEILGAFIYANKDTLRPKQMFLCRDASLSFTVGEWVTRRNAPFDIIEETHGGVTRRLLKGQAYPRGNGSMVPLFVSGDKMP